MPLDGGAFGVQQLWNRHENQNRHRPTSCSPLHPCLFGPVTTAPTPQGPKNGAIAIDTLTTPAVRSRHPATTIGFRGWFRGWVDKYFYFAMSLLIAAIVVWGFSHTIDANLFHGAPPRPLLLWIHGAAFSLWVAFYIFQSALARTRNLRIHRVLGWFGVGLVSVMVVLGFVIAVIMGRFDKHILHLPDFDTFLSVSFGDMIVFGTCAALAIAWRRKPEFHRRLLLIATCALLSAPFGRIQYIIDHSIFYAFVDA